MRTLLATMRESTLSIICLAVLVVLTVACKSMKQEGAQAEAVIQPVLTAWEQPTQAREQFSTLQPTRSREVGPTLTLTPSTPSSGPITELSVTETLAPGPTVTTTPTITPIPTLTHAEESAFLRELMTTNGGCELPCWWGIIPGQTQMQQARDMFAESGLNRWYDASDGTYRQIILGHRAEDQAHYPLELDVRMYENRGTVDIIVVSSLHQPLDETGLFLNEWAPFALSEVLTQFGSPSSVRLFVPPNPGEMAFDLYLLYKSSGIQVRYRVAGRPVNEGRFKLCFTLADLLSIELTLFSPHRYHLAEKLTASSVTSLPTWSEVIGQDVDGFADIFGNSGASCIELQMPSN